MSGRPLYVETTTRAPVAEVWRRTQDPVAHARWDLRFTRIDLDAAGPTPGSPRTFTYAVGPVAGVGVTSADRHHADGSATSALRFRCDDVRSPLREGRGYWRYVPTDDGGTRFLTGYDYTPRGPADRLVRPLLGWATAWSFDRLRLWVDEGLPPETARRNALLEGALRVGAAALGAGLVVAAVRTPHHRLVPSALRCRRQPRPTTSREATP